MACQAKKHSSFTAVVMVLIIQAVAATRNEGIRDGHLNFLNVDVSVSIEFDWRCAELSNITDIILTVPQGSNTLNVLEYANNNPSVNITEYEVFYFHNLGYYLFSINQLRDTTDCRWIFITDPDVSPDDGILNSLDDVLISNFGFEVTYRYVLFDMRSFIKPTIDPVFQTTSEIEPIPADIIGPSINISYQIRYPIPSCQPGSGVSSTINFFVPEGSSALSVLERGARADPQRFFVAKNFIGFIYNIEIIGSMNDTASCQWCPSFSPPNSGPAITILSVNDYVIPVSHGVLRLEYRDSCISFILNAINAGNITDEVLEEFGIDTGSGASTVILCPPLMILTIITSFLIKFYM